jgi:hypothetical protein
VYLKKGKFQRVSNVFTRKRNSMNSFCRYCAGENFEEVKECDFKDCVFYPFRHSDLDWQVREQEIRTHMVLEPEFFDVKIKL